MDRTKPASNTPERREMLTFPQFHRLVEKAVETHFSCVWVRKSAGDTSADREYATHVMGRFQCLDTTCDTNGWTSKKVAILIRGYANNGYNAVVFNQRCRRCNHLGTLSLDKESYVARVAYRLQKWAGIPLRPPYYNSEGGPPHEQSLCEGCRRGVCRQAGD